VFIIASPTPLTISVSILQVSFAAADALQKLFAMFNNSFHNHGLEHPFKETFGPASTILQSN
jgi:hypothetical protein